MALELKNYDPALMQGANIGVAVDLTDITDNNGNEVIEIDGVASAVNYLAVVNSATADPVLLVSRGDDTNIGMKIDGKGSGSIVLAGTSTGGITLTTAVTAASSVLSTSATAGIGYGTGAGGTVTQATSKATGVTLSKVCGTIVMNAASLAADTTVAFTLTNTAIAANDVVVVVHDLTGTLGAYSFAVTPAAGSALISVHNNTPAALAEAIQLRFAVIKAVVA